MEIEVEIEKVVAALDDAIEACRDQFGDADEAGERIAILRNVRDRISAGPSGYRVSHKADKREYVEVVAVGGVYEHPRQRADHIARQYGGTVMNLYGLEVEQ